MKILMRIIREEYIYESEEEKLTHKAEMESKGFEDSGQVKKDINMSFSNPDYRIYGIYYKYEK